MLKIRFSRTGKSAQPSFRIVVQEHTSPVAGKFIETMGFYKPASKDKECKINIERVKYWLSVGAKPSDPLAVLLKHEGLEGMEKYMEPRNRKRTKKKAQPEPAPQAAAPVAAAVVEAAPAPEPVVEAPAEPVAEAPAAEEAKVEEAVAPVEEAPAAEEAAAPAEEAPAEEPKPEAPAA